MHYVYLTDNVVTDQAQIDPFTIFTPTYAEGFIEAADEVTFGWTYHDGQFSPPPGPTPEQIAAQNKQQASALLQATDWVNEPDVIDPTRFPHLTNRDEFLDYRSDLRLIAVNPPTTPVTDWPTKPATVWA
jgi:hypothetical protein